MYFQGLGVSKNLFRHAGRLQKSSEDKQPAPVGVHRYGRARVAQEVKILAKQAFFGGKSENQYHTESIRSDAKSKMIRPILTVTDFIDSLKALEVLYFQGLRLSKNHKTTPKYGILKETGVEKWNSGKRTGAEKL